MSIFGEPVVYVDIETSGGSLSTSKIIEIAAIRVEDGEIVEEFNSLINPGMSIPYWIAELTGLSNNDVVQAPYFEDIAYQLNAILEGALFIAHNVRFDYSYIKKELQAAGYAYNPKLLCTVRLSRALYSDCKGHSLQKIIERHSIAVSARHRAYDDTKAIKDFSELAYREKGAAAFELAVEKQLKTQTLPPHLKETAMQKITNKPGVYVFEDEAGQPLYVGKSVTLRKRVLSHFSQDIKQTKEMKLSKSVHNVRVIETKNELEALLLESQMVKELLPIHNKQLRRTSSHFVLLKEVNLQGYSTIKIADVDLSEITDLKNIYGVYTAKSKAKAALERNLRTFQLCAKLLGLENCEHACFLTQLGKCNGACIGKETAERYNMRVDIALEHSRIEHWPFKSPIAISDSTGDGVVIYNWIILGYLNYVEAGEPDFRPVKKRFNLDTYKILRGYIKKNYQRLEFNLYNAPSFEA